jgi:predicted TPR repeat methyltransferase
VSFGRALEERQDYEAAEAQFRRAISIDPDHAAAYEHLGSLFRHQIKNENAIAAYRFAMEIDPRRELPAHFLAALTGETTQTAPVSYVQGLFDSYAQRYDKHMVVELQYRVPTFVRGLVGRLMEPGRCFDKVIDLGCGTGLSGVQFRDAAKCLHGVDLSPRMIEESKKKNVYDRLEAANIKDFLSAPGTRYDLFIATDVFIYVGALEGIFAAISQRAERNAFFAFSTETCEGDYYALATTGRYTHSRPYVEGLARENGFRVGAREQVPLRLESGQPVMGDIYVLQCSSV